MSSKHQCLVCGELVDVNETHRCVGPFVSATKEKPEDKSHYTQNRPTRVKSRLGNCSIADLIALLNLFTVDLESCERSAGNAVAMCYVMIEFTNQLEEARFKRDQVLFELNKRINELFD